MLVFSKDVSGTQKSLSQKLFRVRNKSLKAMENCFHVGLLKVDSTHS